MLRYGILEYLVKLYYENNRANGLASNARDICLAY